MKRLLCLLLLTCSPALADGPTDNLAENVRRIPPAGVPIPDEMRTMLTAEVERLGNAIGSARAELKEKPAYLRYLPDVQIFHKAVDWALRYDEFYDPKQAEWANDQLREGFSRLESLANLKTPWLEDTGLVPRGYQSKIDGSIQPFGMVVPESFQKNLPYRWRLDCWFHGRGEKLTELDFIHQRQTQPGEFTPPDTLVLHPYGRYCNGQRFAGETDFFEALETVKRDYRIDEDRIIVRGFSLGGAACWHIATHHAWQWCAANPGAGFSETEQFLNFFQGEKLQPQPWERKLWNLYDSTAVAGNLFNVPTVAYSGELDKQKQAADLMAAALKKEGMELTHIIGPKTAHKFEATAKAEVAHRLDFLAKNGRRKALLDSKTTTWTLRNNSTPVGKIDALGEHWKLASLDTTYRVVGQESNPAWHILAKNVTAFTIDIPPGMAFDHPMTWITIASTEDSVKVFSVNGWKKSDGSLQASFHRAGQTWATGPLPTEGLRKKHGLQGPIDDAFMDSFIFVRPTGQAASEKAGAWAKAEMERAIEHWRRHFRGDARVKDDTAITEDDIKSANLILWGDPSSNALIAKATAQLPISWTGSEIKAGAKTFPAADHALIAIYPNALNPERYIVLNSSFTFREYDYLNNARQTPKLPDWAVIDLNQAPNARTPGRIAAADFFGEKWELKPAE
jgi:dienelactone hydrolase